MTLSLDTLNASKNSICFVTKVIKWPHAIIYENNAKNLNYKRYQVLSSEAMITRSFITIRIDEHFFAISSHKDETNKCKFIVNPFPIKDIVFAITPISELGVNLEKLSFAENNDNVLSKAFFVLNVDSEYQNELNQIFRSYVDQAKIII